MTESMHLQIVSGAENVKFTAPNKFTFQLPTQYFSSSDDYVSLKSLRLYYSWFNVTEAKKNNRFSYTWVDGSSHNVTMQDGIWSFADFQAFFQLEMFNNGHYLLNNGVPEYFMRFDVNSVFYRMSLTVRPVPAVLPDGYTAPPGWVAPGSTVTPQVNIPATAIRDYLGYSEGSYPAAPQASLYQVNGATVPQVTDISSLMIQTNLVRNEYGPDSRCLATFNVEPGTAPGSLITEIPYYQDWIPIQPNSKFQTINLFVVDQNSRPVALQDIAGFTVTMTIKAQK